MRILCSCLAQLLISSAGAGHVKIGTDKRASSWLSLIGLNLTFSHISYGYPIDLFKIEKIVSHSPIHRTVLVVFQLQKIIFAGTELIGSPVFDCLWFWVYFANRNCSSFQSVEKEANSSPHVTLRHFATVHVCRQLPLDEVDSRCWAANIKLISVGTKLLHLRRSTGT